jgi:REP element-mobilizing transposase RayT
MIYDPHTHHRRSIRLKGYDYSQAGMYFLTICAHERGCLFGEITDGMISLNDAGRMIQSVWDDMPKHYSGVVVDEFVIMPNHVHGIVAIISVGAGPRACPVSVGAAKTGQARRPAPTMFLPEIVHRFKTMTTKRYIDGVRQNGWLSFQGKLWQRNYWEHVIRNESDLTRIREYIHNNPLQWESDKLHPDFTAPAVVGAAPRGRPDSAPRSDAGQARGPAPTMSEDAR